MEMFITIPDRIYEDQTLFSTWYLIFWKTCSRCSICFIFVIHISELQEIEEFSKAIYTILNALIKSGVRIFENGVFLFTDAQVWSFAFKFIINE